MKNNKGITLIALIVTIIVLIILAGVAIAMLRDDNGILNNASTARYMNIIGNFDERAKLAQMSTKMNITTKMTTTNGYIATAREDDINSKNLKDLADSVAKELGVSALNGRNSTATGSAQISRSTYTVAYYADDAGSATNNGDGYIVIWYTDNSLRSSIPDISDETTKIKFQKENQLIEGVNQTNYNRNQFVLASVIHVTNYNCTLVGRIMTSTTDADKDLQRNNFVPSTSDKSSGASIYTAALAPVDNSGATVNPLTPVSP